MEGGANIIGVVYDHNKKRCFYRSMRGARRDLQYYALKSKKCVLVRIP